jgi:hypothetical protein
MVAQARHSLSAVTAWSIILLGSIKIFCAGAAGARLKAARNYRKKATFRALSRITFRRLSGIKMQGNFYPIVLFCKCIVWEIFRMHQYQCIFVCCIHCLFFTLVALNGLG